jgi:hypothetical protein
MVSFGKASVEVKYIYINSVNKDIPWECDMHWIKIPILPLASSVTLTSH